MCLQDADTIHINDTSCRIDRHPGFAKPQEFAVYRLEARNRSKYCLLVVSR